MSSLLGMLGLPGYAEILVVAFVGLLLFGRRLPEVARSLGRSVVEFKKGVRDIRDDVTTSSRQPDRTLEAPPAPGPAIAPTTSAAPPSSAPPSPTQPPAVSAPPPPPVTTPQPPAVQPPPAAQPQSAGAVQPVAPPSSPAPPPTNDSPGE